MQSTYRCTAFICYLLLSLSVQPVTAGNLSFPDTGQDLRDRALSGIEAGIEQARRTSDGRYVLWHRESASQTYKIISSQLFYYGVFSAYFWDVADAAGLRYRLTGDVGDQPNILIVMDYKINSWNSVAQFLKDHDDTGYEGKLAVARRTEFTGCSFALLNTNGIASGAIIVINISHPVSQVRDCIYRTTFSIFGFSPKYNPSKYTYGMSLDLAVVAALYRLRDDQLRSDVVKNALLNELGLN